MLHQQQPFPFVRGWSNQERKGVLLETRNKSHLAVRSYRRSGDRWLQLPSRLSVAAIPQHPFGRSDISQGVEQPGNAGYFPVVKEHDVSTLAEGLECPTAHGGARQCTQRARAEGCCPQGSPRRDLCRSEGTSRRRGRRRQVWQRSC